MEKNKAQIVLTAGRPGAKAEGRFIIEIGTVGSEKLYWVQEAGKEIAEELKGTQSDTSKNTLR